MTFLCFSLVVRQIKVVRIKVLNLNKTQNQFEGNNKNREWKGKYKIGLQIGQKDYQSEKYFKRIIDS